VGFGERLYSAFSILETQDGQCRFDRRKEVVVIGECGSSNEVVESMMPYHQQCAALGTMLTGESGVMEFEEQK
jgi:hypothetical protein